MSGDAVVMVVEVFLCFPLFSVVTIVAVVAVVMVVEGFSCRYGDGVGLQVVLWA